MSSRSNVPAAGEQEVAKQRGKGGSGRGYWEPSLTFPALATPSTPHPDWKALLALPSPNHCWEWATDSQGPFTGHPAVPSWGPLLRVWTAQVPASSEQPLPQGRVTWQLRFLMYPLMNINQAW